MKTLRVAQYYLWNNCYNYLERVLSFLFIGTIIDYESMAIIQHSRYIGYLILVLKYSFLTIAS